MRIQRSLGFALDDLCQRYATLHGFLESSDFLDISARIPGRVWTARSTLHGDTASLRLLSWSAQRECRLDWPETFLNLSSFWFQWFTFADSRRPRMIAAKTAKLRENSKCFRYFKFRIAKLTPVKQVAANTQPATMTGIGSMV